MIIFILWIMVTMMSPAWAQPSNTSLQATVVAIPDGEKGIGFDDMTYSVGLHKVLIPAGHTGKLYLIDPATFAMTSIGGFSKSAEYQKGHDIGITSVDEGEGYVFVLDHGRQELEAVDLKTSATIATAKLAGDSDYVRYVNVNHELWVTEPHNKQIEVFKFLVHEQTLSPIMLIALPEGPESLVIDHLRGRAYTNVGHQAAAIDLELHTVVTQWPNGCEKSRGDALDEQKGFLFVSCAEGKASVFDVNGGHQAISQLATDPGADVISYNAKLSHLYLTSGKKETLSVLGVSPQGKLSLLAQARANTRSHCVVSDDQDNIWVCDPLHGQLLRFKDSL